MRIPMVNFRPLLAATEPVWRARLEEFFERQQFILGPQVAAFERELAAQWSAREAVTVGTGTAAIELALKAAGVNSPRQEVITSALTAPFTGTAIVGSGAGLRVADIDPETLLIDANDAGNRATRRTAAIVPVHLYGQPCEMAPIRRLAKELKAVVVQDACQAHGARHRGRQLTRYSPLVAYSFYPTKNLGALGDGGSVLTSSPALARKLRMLRDGGRRNGRQVAEIKGINSRLDELQACYLRAFLPKLEEWNTHRQRLARHYRIALRDCPGVRLPLFTGESVCHLFVVRAERREKLREYLAQHGIGTGVHYPVPLHLMPAFRETGLRRGDLPHAERAAREVVSLPLWPYMEEGAAQEVAERVRQFYRR